MRKLLVALVLSAVVAWAPNVMAGSAGFQNWMEKWRIEQAEQNRIDRSLDRLDRDAASWGAAAGAGDQTMPQQPVSPKKKARPEY
ncbi:MAG: hypothetical protein HY914_19480 [Desulfomonile tiedjei]|nr:hypothetical protein [Desulfomonile tiedjei]